MLVSSQQQATNSKLNCTTVNTCNGKSKGKKVPCNMKPLFTIMMAMNNNDMTATTGGLK